MTFKPFPVCPGVNTSFMSRRGPSWQWSYGSWIYNYLCNQCLSPLMLEFESRSRWGVQHYVIKVVSDMQQVGCFLRVRRHDITEILLKVALNTIKQTKQKSCLGYQLMNWYKILLARHQATVPKNQWIQLTTGRHLWSSAGLSKAMIGWNKNH
jgi:hypothetical protein